VETVRVLRQYMRGFRFLFKGLRGARKWQGAVDSKKVNAALVEQRLAGRADSPKEFEVGVQVFGRPSDYDCRIDPVVRVQACLPRFKLHEMVITAAAAETFAMLGRKRDASDYLNASYKKRELYMVALNVAPTLASLRSEPDYQDLPAHLGLDVPN
jgi:hypothetical protein